MDRRTFIHKASALVSGATVAATAQTPAQAAENASADALLQFRAVLNEAAERIGATRWQSSVGPDYCHLMFLQQEGNIERAILEVSIR